MISITIFLICAIAAAVLYSGTGALARANDTSGGGQEECEDDDSDDSTESCEDAEENDGSNGKQRGGSTKRATGHRSTKSGGSSQEERESDPAHCTWVVEDPDDCLIWATACVPGGILRPLGGNTPLIPSNVTPVEAEQRPNQNPSRNPSQSRLVGEHLIFYREVDSSEGPAHFAFDVFDLRGIELESGPSRRIRDLPGECAFGDSVVQGLQEHDGRLTFLNKAN